MTTAQSAFRPDPVPARSSRSVAVLLLELYLAWAYRAAFKPMLNPGATAT
jgi:hypothetical protein